MDADYCRYLFTANTREVQVLSTETSLVERVLSGPSGKTVTAFALSSVNPDRLYVASSTGNIQCWDWTVGTPVGERRRLDGQLHALATCRSELGETDIVYAVTQDGNGWNIVADDEVVFSSNEPIHSLEVAQNVLVAALPGKILVGNPVSSQGDASTKQIYTFAEISIGSQITRISARLQAPISAKAKGRSAAGGVLSVAVGTTEGQILLYEDLPFLQPVQGSKIVDIDTPSPRVMHWHREAVTALKWSRDGNYLISGGKETVIVMWQLQTGKKQFLPHLTAEIEALTVSSDGTSYAVQLSDNSVMVLSTTELKPTANFAGLQASSLSYTRPAKKEQSKALDHSRTKVAGPYPALLHPVYNDQLLLSVPASSCEHVDGQTTRSKCFLQTYDLAADRHVSRQALTRNNITDFNKGPEGNKLVEPDVSLMQISNDGQWLATVEEWAPAPTDVEFLAANQEVQKEQRRARAEIYLKIWHWSEERKLWILETRIDAPHQVTGSAQPGRILSLTADPVETGFSTVGDDSRVRIWKPKTRLRNGIVVRGSRPEGLTDWSCRYVVQLDALAESSESDAHSSALHAPKTACAAYSADGSMLAVSPVYEDSLGPSDVYFIDTASGELRDSRSGLFSGSLRSLAFLDRYLLTLSTSLVTVWDVIDETLIYSREVNSTEGETSVQAPALLAVNHDDESFAIAAPSTKGKSFTRVEVYKPSTAEMVFGQDVPTIVTALLTVAGRRGYTVLTDAAEIRTLSPRSSAVVRVQSLPQPQEVAVEEVSLVDDEEMDDAAADIEDEPATATSLPTFEDDNERPVVRPEQLAQVFDAGQSFALPSVKDMFASVVELYGRKPRVVSAGVAAGA